MRVLAVTLLPRYQMPAWVSRTTRDVPQVAAIGRATQWHDAPMRSIFTQEWDGMLEHVILNGETLTGTRYDRVTQKYELARRMTLDGGYDALWTAEYDMILPSDALRRLAAVDADIVYGLYVWRRRPHLWSAYKVLWPSLGYSISQIPQVAREAWGQQIEVAGVGHGCTLIRRQVLEQISFYRDGAACADWYMALDAQERGFRQVCDCGVACGHMSLTPRPVVYWPDPDQPDLYRVDEVA